jgi:hypothetical protein
MTARTAVKCLWCQGVIKYHWQLVFLHRSCRPPVVERAARAMPAPAGQEGTASMRWCERCQQYHIGPHTPQLGRHLRQHQSWLPPEPKVRAPFKKIYFVYFKYTYGIFVKVSYDLGASRGRIGQKNATETTLKPLVFVAYRTSLQTMIQQGCAFGGTPNAWLSLTPSILPPTLGYRIISGAIWWPLIFWPWRKYLAIRAAGIPAPTPSLTPPGVSHTFFTDRESLQGLVSPGEYASRLALPPRAHTECQRYGCAVVEFTVPHTLIVIAPPPYPDVQQGDR